MSLENNLENLKNNQIFNLLKHTGCDVYLVGGAVRDILSERSKPEDIHDFDVIVTDRRAKDFADDFAKNNDVATVVTLDEVNNIYRVVMADKINYIDVTNPINDSLEDDINRRDITINSIAYNINTQEIYDITGGVSDLKNGIIRAVSEENFIDDPLRIIRAFRFASVFGYKIEDNTLQYIERHKGLILKPAVERRNCEILKLFGGKYAVNVLEMMDKIGIVDILFPIMLDVKKVPPNTHHHLDLFNHSLSTVKYIQEIYENSRPEGKEHLESIDFGGDTRLAHLKLAGFLHDIGKFSTWTIEDDGRHRFIRHDEIGEQLAKGILKEQKFSKKQIDYISGIIRHHIYPSSVVSAPNKSDKIYMRYVRKAGDDSIDWITVAKADRLSARGPAVSDEMVKNNLDALDELQDFYIRVKPTLVPLPKLLNGKEIMKIRNMEPSKELGEIIDALTEAQQDGKVLTKDDAIRFVTDWESV